MFALRGSLRSLLALTEPGPTLGGIASDPSE
jgi:hypothetical protein